LDTQLLRNRDFANCQDPTLDDVRVEETVDHQSEVATTNYERARTASQVFTDEQEFAMAATILDDYIAVGSLFSSATFRAVARKIWEELGRDPATFTCSQAFIRRFKERNGFSSRRFHAQRRGPAGSQ
jgi:hypothetical protein